MTKITGICIIRFFKQKDIFMDGKPIEFPSFAKDESRRDSAGKYSFFSSKPSFPAEFIKPQFYNFKDTYLNGKCEKTEAKEFLIRSACRAYALYQKKSKMSSSFNTEMASFKGYYATFHKYYCDSAISWEDAEIEAMDLLENFPKENEIGFQIYFTKWIFNLIKIEEKENTKFKKRSIGSSGITSVETVEEEKEDTFLTKRRCFSSKLG